MMPSGGVEVAACDHVARSPCSFVATQVSKQSLHFFEFRGPDENQIIAESNDSFGSRQYHLSRQYQGKDDSDLVTNIVRCQ